MVTIVADASVDDNATVGCWGSIGACEDIGWGSFGGCEEDPPEHGTKSLAGISLGGSEAGTDGGTVTVGPSSGPCPSGPCPGGCSGGFGCGCC